MPSGSSPRLDDHARCATCGGALDPELYALCAVCEQPRLCAACAPAHMCTDRCAERGCRPGLCVKMVRGGVVAEEFGA